MVKHTQTSRLFPTYCMSLFDHFVRLALKRFKRHLEQLAFVTEAPLEPSKTSKIKRFMESVNGF